MMAESSHLQYFEKPFVIVVYGCVMNYQTQWLKRAPIYELRVLLVRSLACHWLFGWFTCSGYLKIEAKMSLEFSSSGSGGKSSSNSVLKHWQNSVPFSHKGDLHFHAGYLPGATLDFSMSPAFLATRPPQSSG